MIAPRFPDLPDHMKALRLDHRGFPVPWFVDWNDAGEPVFPAIDHAKFVKAVKVGLCWVCGGKLGRFRASVIGPMCAINRTISEPQSHVDCARFSARNCPFLANPRMGRVPVAKIEEKAGVAIVPAAGDGILRNPGACAVWIETRRTQPFKVGTGWLFELGDPESVEWYANGREATREEVEHSIFTGLPLLAEACRKESTEARRAAALAELERRTKGVGRYLPLGLAA